jgi:hypothetical protein
LEEISLRSTKKIRDKRNISFLVGHPLLLLCTRPQTAVHHNQLAATPRTLNAKLAVFDKMNLTKGSQLSWYKIDFVEFELKRGSRLIGSSIARLKLRLIFHTSYPTKLHLCILL